MGDTATEHRWPNWLSEAPVPKRAIVIGILFVIASTAQGVVGIFYEEVPGWKMFRRAVRYDYILMAYDKQYLNIRDYVPQRAYTIKSAQSVGEIAEWYARTHPDKAPIRGRFLELSRHGVTSQLDFVVKVDEQGQSALYELVKPAETSIVQKGDD